MSKQCQWLWLLVPPFLVTCAPAVTTRPANRVEVTDRIAGRQAWIDMTMVPERLRVPGMDVFGGYYVLYSTTGRFCVVNAADWSAGPADGEYYACRWRDPRGSR